MEEWIIRFVICLGVCAIYFFGYAKGQNDAYNNIIDKLSEDNK